MLAVPVLASMICAGIYAQPKLNPNNVDAVVKAMTLEEKAQMIVGYTFGRPYFGVPTSPDPNEKALVPGAAGETARIERFGIPNTVLSDGPAGLRISPIRPNDTKTYYCTGFPVGICLSSSWNTELVNKVGTAMGNEVREYGADVLLGPGMNIHRNPLCGRNFEYFSEDPFLTGKIAAAWVRGIQSNGVGTSVKHFAANNQETNRLGNDARVDQRTLREIYLKGFEIAIREANPWTVMDSYNKLNGDFTQYSRDLLTTILRDDWGYKGVVMSDWTNTRDTPKQVYAGTDLLEPGNKAQMDAIIASVKNGTLDIKDVDNSLRRILQYIVKTPSFRGYRYSNAPDLKAHAQITRQAAAEGMVLLKNENGTLPLDVSAKNVALFGKISYMLYAGGTGSGDVNKPYVVDLKQGLVNAGCKLDTAIEQMYRKYFEFGRLTQKISSQRYGSFAPYAPEDRVQEPILGKYVYGNYARKSDVAIITIGRSSGEGGDRKISDFNLDAGEQEMVGDVCDAFHQAGKKVVVILNVGGVIETASWKDKPDAILLAWQPGQEGGNSIADVLTGKVSPSGKLPDTFPVSIDDVPSTKNFPYDTDYIDLTFSSTPTNKDRNIGYTNYEEGLNVGYRYFATNGKAVSYPFGYGLTYTRFEYADAKVKKSGNHYIATVTVTNTGDKIAKEVVELYVSAPKGNLVKPAMELKSFAKTRELKPGESQKLEMTFSNYDLASYDTGMHSWVTDAGTYQAKFAASCEDIRLTVPFKASSGVVECHDVLNLK